MHSISPKLGRHRSPWSTQLRPRGMPVKPYGPRECISKASTAFLPALLARVDGECIGLDGTALKSTGCLPHPALAARVATGTAVDYARTVRTLAGTTIRDGMGLTCTITELDGKRVPGALLVVSGVRRYAQKFSVPTRSRVVVPTNMCVAVRDARSRVTGCAHQDLSAHTAPGH